MIFSNKNYWALILGGSSGFGLETAKYLSRLGINLFIVHRDRKGSMSKIQEEFDAITKNENIKFKALNIDALSNEGISTILNTLEAELQEIGKVRLLMHSIAFGNLKLIAPEKELTEDTPIKKLAKTLNLKEEVLSDAVNTFFNEGDERFLGIADNTSYNSDILIDEEDMQNTIYSMGSSILKYTQEIFKKKLFAPDARVIGMTSEGNEVAWKGYAAVSAAKVTLESIIRSIALEFAPFGIRANAIQAGVTNTPALRLIPGNKHLLARAKQRNPFKRLTTVSDVAKVITLLVQDEASWVNGNVIRVDGGEHIVG